MVSLAFFFYSWLFLAIYEITIFGFAITILSKISFVIMYLTIIYLDMVN